jgi:hypothetical protein
MFFYRTESSKLLLDARVYFFKAIHSRIFTFKSETKHYDDSMASTSKLTTSVKHTDKFNRRKCINALEKMTKNMFRLFRDEQTTNQQLVDRFTILKKRIDQFDSTHLDSEYHRAMRQYATTLGNTISKQFNIDDIRSSNMTQLNRIQKIKNSTDYTRDKNMNEIE